MNSPKRYKRLKKVRAFGFALLAQAVMTSVFSWVFTSSGLLLVGLIFALIGLVLVAVAIAELRSIHRNIEAQKMSAASDEDDWLRK